MNVTLGRDYADGEKIIEQGEHGDCMYVIQSGSVSVTHEADGRTTELAKLGRGEMFGEMALFDKEVRSATVKAVGKAKIMKIDKRTFLGRVEEDPTIAFRLVKKMAGNIRDLNSRLASTKGTEQQDV